MSSWNIGASAAEEHYRVAGDPPSLKIFLRHQRPRNTKSKGSVLFVHGATFPSALAAAFKFDGHSWMDDLSEAGFDVWALDFEGYGESDRYPEMNEPPTAHRPLGTADTASRQIAAAIRFIRQHEKVDRVSIIAHSWGTIPAGVFVTQEPAVVDRLILFGPVALRREPQTGAPTVNAYRYLTIRSQHDRFYGYVPAGEKPVLDPHHFEAWAKAYLATDATSSSRNPPSVRVPQGPNADFEKARGGNFPYDPAKISVPTLIIRGEWDTITTDEDAHWLFHALRAAPIKRDVVISRGTHVMHLEQARFQLYREVQLFLEDRDMVEAH
jgi:pimeloyl-ACP methyl ester carboxylesterase